MKDWSHEKKTLLFMLLGVIFVSLLNFGINIYRLSIINPPVETTEALENIKQPDSPVSYDAMAELINIKRSQNGVQPALISSKALNASAQLKANDMVERNYWSHNDPEGKEPWQYFKTVGYDYRRAGENLAKCYYTPQEVVNAWYDSPEHKANILGDFKEIGFGVGTMDNGCLLIVNHFGKR